MSHTIPSVTDDVFEQFRLIDKHLSNAQAALALGLVDQALDHLQLAKPLSDSLLFRLVSERMEPETRCIPPDAPQSAQAATHATATEPELAVQP